MNDKTFFQIKAHPTDPYTVQLRLVEYAIVVKNVCISNIGYCELNVSFTHKANGFPAEMFKKVLPMMEEALEIYKRTGKAFQYEAHHERSADKR